MITRESATQSTSSPAVSMGGVGGSGANPRSNKEESRRVGMPGCVLVVMGTFLRSLGEPCST
jgi:hypothetical protein